MRRRRDGPRPATSATACRCRIPGAANREVRRVGAKEGYHSGFFCGTCLRTARGAHARNHRSSSFAVDPCSLSASSENWAFSLSFWARRLARHAASSSGDSHPGSVVYPPNAFFIPLGMSASARATVQSQCRCNDFGGGAAGVAARGRRDQSSACWCQSTPCSANGPTSSAQGPLARER
jgi:hypothetical protein